MGRMVGTAGVRLASGPRDIEADYYIAAMPAEQMAQLVSAELKVEDPSLAHLDRLHTEWMNNLQFFLSEERPLSMVTCRLSTRPGP
jgi:hypothetical protein